MAHGDNVIALDQWRAKRAPSDADIARHPAHQKVQRDAPDANRLALRMMTRKDLTERELRQALKQRECLETDIDQAVEMVIRDGYLDDHRVALQAAERALHQKHWSNHAMRNALRGRGISDDIIKDVFAELEDVDDLDEFDRAFEVATKAYRHYVSLDETVARRRLVGVLQRRGFGGSLIQHVIAKVLDPDSGE